MKWRGCLGNEAGGAATLVYVALVVCAILMALVLTCGMAVL